LNLAPAPASVHAAELEGGVVRVELADGGSVELHRFALRDACPCPSCRHPLSAQRLFESSEVLPAARVSAVALGPDGLRIDWADGHVSLFPFDWLEAEAQAQHRGARPRRPLTFWGAELVGRLPAADYDEVVGEQDAFVAWLAAVAELGFALLRGVPREEGAVAAVAELFSPVRTTNYGRVFDVSVRVGATNLADSAGALSLHTDNPYRQPAPTLQLLECLSASLAGGETVLVDGFRAVALLGEFAPDKLATLARQAIRYRYADAGAEFFADVPVVSLDLDGEPLSLQVNNRSKGVPVGAPELVARWYEAYFALLALLERRDAQLSFRLEPGELLVLDNRRVLHGRRAFADHGERRLQGCYADRDALLSTLACATRSAA
jgi:gamma-butyrobetaine dioxygenase